MTLTVQKITGSPEAVLAELARAITEAGNHKAKPLDEELLGLERKPHERVRTIDPKAAANGKPVARKVENILLTIREDLLEARKHLLDVKRHGADDVQSAQEHEEGENGELPAHGTGLQNHKKLRKHECDTCRRPEEKRDIAKAPRARKTIGHCKDKLSDKRRRQPMTHIEHQSPVPVVVANRPFMGDQVTKGRIAPVPVARLHDKTALAGENAPCDNAGDKRQRDRNRNLKSFGGFGDRCQRHRPIVPLPPEGATQSGKHGNAGGDAEFPAQPAEKEDYRRKREIRQHAFPDCFIFQCHRAILSINVYHARTPAN